MNQENTRHDVVESLADTNESLEFQAKETLKNIPANLVGIILRDNAAINNNPGNINSFGDRCSIQI